MLMRHPVRLLRPRQQPRWGRTRRRARASVLVAARQAVLTSAQALVQQPHGAVEAPVVAAAAAVAAACGCAIQAAVVVVAPAGPARLAADAARAVVNQQILHHRQTPPVGAAGRRGLPAVGACLPAHLHPRAELLQMWSNAFWQKLLQYARLALPAAVAAAVHGVQLQLSLQQQVARMA